MKTKNCRDFCDIMDKLVRYEERLRDEFLCVFSKFSLTFLKHEKYNRQI